MKFNDGKLEELTEVEKKRPYSRFYYKKPAEPSKELLDHFAKKIPMDPSKAITAGNINDMLKSGYLEEENGFCILPDGCGYVAVDNKMPGVTFGMYQFWLKWWQAEDLNLRYKIWYPGHHFRSGYRWTLEDTGSGLEDIVFLDVLTPKNLGFDEELYKKSSLLLADGAYVVSKHVGNDITAAPTPGVVCHFVREMEDGSGIELRSRFWLGYQAGENGLYCALNDGVPKITLEDVSIMADHNAREMANLASILPDLYAEEKNSV